MVDEFEKDGVKPIVYMNPYLADLSQFGVNCDLFDEALSQDYFIKN